MLIKIHQVISKTGKSRSQIYAQVRQGTFPAPIKLSERSSAWVAAEVDEWIASRIAASRKQEREVA